MTILAMIGAAVVAFCGGMAFLGIMAWMFGIGDKPEARQPVAPVPMPDKPEPDTRMQVPAWEKNEKVEAPK